MSITDGWTSTQRGAWSELQAAAWLVERGYEVFKGLVGTEACDFIALRRETGELTRVEVKSGMRQTLGSIQPDGYRKMAIAIRDTSLYDLLLVVSPEGVVYPDPGPDVCTWKQQNVVRPAN